MAGPGTVPLSGLLRFCCKLTEVDSCGIGHPFEFQLGCFTKKLEGTLGVFDARELHHNFRLALTNNHRFCHPELINPVTDNFKGLFNGMGTDKVNFRILEGHCDLGKGSFLGIHFHINFLETLCDNLIDHINGTGVGQGKKNSAWFRFCPYCTDALLFEVVFQLCGCQFQGVCFRFVQVDLEDKMHASLKIKAKT